MGNELQRRELAHFIRSRRERLSPEACGFTTGPRRRTGGLRREEVASLAGVSPSWYTKLEQGRDINISVRFLKSLADALQLSFIERTQLFGLGLAELSIPSSPDEEELLPAIQRMVDAMPTSPALIMTSRMDYIGCNAAALTAFGVVETDEMNKYGRNLLLSLFLGESSRDLLPAWYESARYHVAVFRSAYSRNANNPSFVELVDGLMTESAEFRAIWNEYELRPKRTRHVLYEDKGRLTVKFEMFSLYADIHDNIRIDIYTPPPNGLPGL